MDESVLEPLQQPVLVTRTETSTSLPTYTRSDVPPPYNPPSSLLSTSWLRQYLLILETFQHLKSAILTLEIPNNNTGNDILSDLDERGRWGLFIEMAVRRFGIWQSKYIKEGIRDLPPLDVLMVWCAYLGSPRWYNEDIIKLTTYHPSIIYPDFPLDDVARCIDETSLQFAYSPGAPSETRWKSLTCMPFSPIDYFKTSNQVPVECPSCDSVFSVSWLTPKQDGYAQQGFVATCDACELRVTKEAIGLRRLIDDLRTLVDITSLRLSTHLLSYTHPSSLPPCPLANLMKSLDGSVKDIGHRWKWRREDAAVWGVSSTPVEIDKSVYRLMSGYIGAEKASVDLVAATLRQTSFVEKLNVVGWLEPPRWDSGVESLERAIVRYTRFLQLAKEEPKRLLVPTIGIEIAWQTHLLLASRYVIDTKLCVGHLLDREDAIGEGVLSVAFDDTARRWQSRYKALYSTSGHLPPDSGAPKLTSRLRAWPMPPPSSCPAIIDYTLPIIPIEKESVLSYPSERNSIYVAMDEKSSKSQHKRVMEFQDRLAREVKNETKGKVDPGLVRRAEMIRPAFLTGDVVWERFGPTGYPVTKHGIISTANVMDGRIILARGAVGLGAVGAGLELLL